MAQLLAGPHVTHDFGGTKGIGKLLARVNGLLNELEPEISLVVDALFPYDWLIPILRDFHAKFPTVPVRLMSETLGGVERTLRSGAAHIGIAGRFHTDNTGFSHLDIAGVPIIPVAAPGHPLAAPQRPSAVRAEDCVQLVLSERPNGDKRDFGVISINNWRINDIAAKRRLLRDGLGWGGMPEAMVRRDIKSGTLARLNLPDWRGGVYPMQVMHLADRPPGPAGRWLIDRLSALEAEIDPAGVEARVNKKRVRRGKPTA